MEKHFAVVINLGVIFISQSEYWNSLFYTMKQNNLMLFECNVCVGILTYVFKFALL